MNYFKSKKGEKHLTVEVKRCSYLLYTHYPTIEILLFPLYFEKSIAKNLGVKNCDDDGVQCWSQLQADKDDKCDCRYEFT